MIKPSVMTGNYAKTLGKMVKVYSDWTFKICSLVVKTADNRQCICNDIFNMTLHEDTQENPNFVVTAVANNDYDYTAVEVPISDITNCNITWYGIVSCTVEFKANGMNYALYIGF